MDDISGLLHISRMLVMGNAALDWTIGRAYAHCDSREAL